VPIRIQLAPSAVPAFLDYFSPTACSAVRESETTVRLSIPDAAHAEVERFELNLHLADWRLAHPDTNATVEE